MPEVTFHVNAPDKRSYVCRLLRKAYLQGARVLVIAEAREVDALDAALWTFAGYDFIPHATLTQAAALQAHSPILLGHDWPVEIPRQHEMVLLNLSADILSGFERFARVIEVSGQEVLDRERARNRWRRYRDEGVDLVHHDAAAS